VVVGLGESVIILTSRDGGIVLILEREIGRYGNKLVEKKRAEAAAHSQAVVIYMTELAPADAPVIVTENGSPPNWQI
jgi:hypothetical protein